MKNKTKVVAGCLLVATILSVGVISAVTTPQHQAKAIWFCGACVRGVSPEATKEITTSTYKVKPIVGRR